MKNLSSLLAPLARRYIAGETIADAIAAARALNTARIKATIDNLGENVTDERETAASVNEYIELLERISSEGVDSTVSLKLTHMGLDISDELAYANARAVVKKAHELDNFVRLDMEGSKYTQRTIEILLRLHGEYRNCGVAIQCMLRRSPSDVSLLTGKGASVRLVKGAYKESPEIAFSAKGEVDASYSTLMRELLLGGTRPAIATHDEKLINEAIRFAAGNNIPKDRFEFQMLLGIKRTLQRKLAGEGYTVRVYVPYGSNWLPYTLRRLRERRENVYFVLKNIFD